MLKRITEQQKDIILMSSTDVERVNQRINMMLKITIKSITYTTLDYF